MSLYNLTHGKNEDSNDLLSVLGVTEAYFDRFRDAWITDDGEIAVYTRLGGRNRACYCDTTPEEDEAERIEAEAWARKMFGDGFPTQEEIDRDSYWRRLVFVPRRPRSNGVVHKEWCHYQTIEKIRRHPLFLRDEDEVEKYENGRWVSGDNTYATFYFKVPSKVSKRLTASQNPFDKNQRDPHRVCQEEREIVGSPSRH